MVKLIVPVLREKSPTVESAADRKRSVVAEIHIRTVNREVPGDRKAAATVDKRHGRALYQEVAADIDIETSGCKCGIIGNAYELKITAECFHIQGDRLT